MKRVGNNIPDASVGTARGLISTKAERELTEEMIQLVALAT